MIEKPFSPAADRNKEPILGALKELLTGEDHKVLEVGSGTGQHGAFFSKAFPHLEWVYSDLERNHEGIKAWARQADNANLTGPLVYEAGKDPFPQGGYDLVFTANTLHIMSWKQVKTLIKDLGKNLSPGSRVAIYGPFNYGGAYTSESNERFDRSLKERDGRSGIRAFEDVKKQMESRGFRLLKDYGMPANNRLLAFLKI